MSRLKELHIHHLRNIHYAKIDVDSKFNIFYGENGSGKTSLLEAIYLLTTGHSFRTREISPLVNYEQDSLNVFAKTINDETISIQKSLHEPTRVKINGQFCSASSELAYFLPCQVVYQDIFQIMDTGPSIRRALLDWGLFHVEPSYHMIWKNYQRVLKQRNKLLREQAKRAEFIPWDALIVQFGNQLHSYRMSYFNELISKFILL